MRVHGQGGYFGDQLPDPRQRSKARAFAQGRKVGQVVRGRLVAPAEGGLVWVSIAGHTLLANLDHPVPAGQELLFRIARLDPDLLLQDITPPPEPGTDPARILASLTGARSRLEALLEAALPPLGGGPPLDLTEARRRFRRFLAANAAARATWDVSQHLARQASALLPPGEGRCHYLPWIYPGLGQSELLTLGRETGQGGPGLSLRLFGRLPQCGRLAVLASWRPGQIHYRLLLETPEAAEAIRDSLSRVLFGRADYAPQCQAAGPLPGDLAGGFLAKLLAGRAQPFTGLRLRV
jgi:hypothetical protein